MFEIIKADAGHLDEIARIERETFSLPWDKRMLTSCLEGQSIFLTAISEGKPAAYVSIQYVLDEGYMNNIAVDLPHRRQGLASALLLELDKAAAEHDLAFISLEVRESNFSAIALYRKHGYEHVGRRKKYYEKPVEDAIIMTKYYK